jgi:hypothetical protein
MKLTNHEWLHTGRWMGLLLTVVCLMGTSLESMAQAPVSTTTVQGTVYLANGEPATGTLVVSWPSFTTAAGQLIAADSMTVTIAPDGFMSVNLAPNEGATPAGQYYTATYYLGDGTTSTEYWVIPAAAQATLGAIQAQVMPAAQAVQTVSKTYVDQAIAELAGSMLTVTGTTMTGPLYLSADPTQPLQAAEKHYVDEEFSLAVPLTGATMTGPLTSVQLGALYQVDQFPGADFGAKLAACLSGLSSTNGGTCDARNFTGTLSMGSNLTISTGNATVLLPCATISTANQVIVTEGTRNVTLRGCALRGASTASGSQGGTVFIYSGNEAMIQVGDPTYAADTNGFHLDNAVINTTASSSATAQGLVAYRTQELDLESLYFLGNSNQTGMTLDGTGNYTGGTFLDNELSGFQTAVNAIGHQIANSATTDWLNASTFVRLHIDCPTSNGSPISGSYGINLQQGDGNTFTGGDVEGCSTALHLGANAQNNTIIGLRNENSTNQVVADAGSAYNNWMIGGTMFTGQLTDNGTRNSFLDTFHRSFNGLNGDWYGSQTDATVTNHYRIGTGAGNERGLLSRYQTDYGYRWTMGLSDATAGEQFYQIQDELNNVYRLSIGQYNNGQSSTNNQTVINAAGTGAIVLNGSNNSGTGGVVFGSGGASETTVATINNAGNAQFNGTLQVGGTTTFISTPTVKNQADAEIDATLWAGLTKSQKESFIYKDWNGNSQWYMVKDTSNNWMLNSAVGGLDSFKAYQSTNSGDTYVNASNTTGAVRINYEPGSGTGFYVYGGGNSPLYASFTGAAAIRFPGLEASSGHNCLQIDNSGYITNTGSACGSGSGGSGTISSGSAGQIAYYTAAGTTIGGMSTVPLTAGGTGATTAAGAVSNLIPGATLSGSGSSQVISLPGSVAAQAVALGADPTLETQAATKNYSDIHGGGVVNVTQEYGCAPLSAANVTAMTASGVWTDVNGTTACIQNAINTECAANPWWYRRRLMLEDGTYVIGNSTTEGLIENNCTVDLRGNGRSATRLQHASNALVEDASGNAYTVTEDGAWNPSTTYAVNQVVSRMSNSYVAIAANKGVDPWTDTGTKWVQVNSRLIYVEESPISAGNSITSGGIVDLQLASGPTTTDLFMTDYMLDVPFLMTDVQFAGQQGSLANAIKAPTWLNFHIDHSRFDSIGGYAAAFPGYAASASTYAQASLSALDFVDDTYDNGTTCNGVFNGYKCANGNGIFFVNFTTKNSGATPPTVGSFVNNQGIVSWINGRIELNQILSSYSTASDGLQRSLFRVIENGYNFGSPIYARQPAVTVKIDGSAITQNFGYPQSNAKILSSDAGEVALAMSASQVYGIDELNNNDSGTSLEATALRGAVGYTMDNISPYGGPFSGSDVVSSNFDGVGWQTVYAASLSSVGYIKTGDIVINKSSISGTANAAMYQASCPTAGAGTTSSVTASSVTGIMTSGSAILTLSGAGDSWMVPQHGITVAGAGTSAAALSANILHIDDTGLVLTLDTAAGTSVSGAALTITQCTLNPVVQSASQINGAAVPASATVAGTNANGQIVSQTGTISNSTSGSASSLSAASVIPSGSTTTTPTAGDNSTALATTAFVQNVATTAPAWLRYLGTGADGAYEATAASCTASAPCLLGGDKYYTTFKVDSGAYIYTNEGTNGGGLVVHATRACTINGTILANGTKNTTANSTYGFEGGASGGSGGGTAAGTAGKGADFTYQVSAASASYPPGTAGAASGGNGGNGSGLSNAYFARTFANTTAGLLDGLFLMGSTGMQGGSTGGVGGGAGQGFVAMCASLDGTGGVVDASGGAGAPPSANSTGAGSGGGGGVVILSSAASVTTWPTISVSGGPGGLVTVPEMLATGGTCTTQPKATLGVTSGALSSCTVVQAGAGCGTGTGVTMNILGGGGTGGTVTPTWSGGTLASCTASGGSGYAAATYTTAGTGGDGGPGWSAEFQGW